MLRSAFQRSITSSSWCARLLNKSTLTYGSSSTKQLNLSKLTSRRFLSTSPAAGRSNDAMLYISGTAILVGSAAFAYYAIDTQYTPPKEKTAIEADTIAATSTDVSADVTDDVIDDVEIDDEQLTESSTTVEPLGDISGIPYVIIGAGTAAHAACRAIRKNDANAKILVIGEETFLPYMRPPLSKELWFTDGDDASETLKFKSWDGKERTVFFEDESYYSNHKDLLESEAGGVAVISGRKAVSIDSDEHKVTLDTGDVVSFDKLLIATGGRPRNHPAFDLSDKHISRHTTLFRNVKDFRVLDKKLKKSKSVVVIGGGFLGSELACALAAKGKSDLEVKQLYSEEGNMAKVLPRYLSEWTTRKVQKEGVNIVSNRSVKSSTYENGKMKLLLDNDDQIETDHVIVCVGIEPDTQLAQSAGLEIDPGQGGYRVNSELEARSDIWVAGDAACFYDMNLGRRRVEHHDHAVVSGRLAGENMMGAKKAYKHQSMFWSDLGPEVGYEAIGIVDSTLPTVGVWAKATPQDTPKAAAEASGESIRSEVNESENISEPVSEEEIIDTPSSVDDKEDFGKGVVFYVKEKKIVGIVLWNIFGQMPLARRLISDAKEHEDLNATASLFKLHT